MSRIVNEQGVILKDIASLSDKDLMNMAYLLNKEAHDKVYMATTIAPIMVTTKAKLLELMLLEVARRNLAWPYQPGYKGEELEVREI